ncbi:MAG: ATP-binding cassette domain-containing protein [Candidatus Aminicenantes bacterium]|nr:ATP-binding cassette domain-containing protein [Candidatus Aminicenantes bacterium]
MKEINTVNTYSPLLEIQNLQVTFDSKQILNGFSADLKAGEKIAVTGESGTGKSTLLKCILGFICPDSGIIRISGKDLSSKNVWELRKEIGYVPQEPDLGKGTTESAIYRPFQYKANKNLMPEQAEIHDLFSKLRLDEDLLHKDISILSGGEKQRIAIITALLLKRKIYLFDEATSALDNVTRGAVVDYFQDQNNLSILAVTHDPHLLSLCTRRYNLNKSGRAKD